jgi:pantoate--beta-alanine ligase
LAPFLSEVYPDGFLTYVDQERLTGLLCGRSRPGHFRGVLTVVAKLLVAVMPDRAYFGAKDYQQSVVVRRMVRDLGLPIDIRVLPTVRERDGLAMSSRNAYLSASERKDALCLYHALLQAKMLVTGGEIDCGRIVESMRGLIGQVPSARIDYVEIVDPEELAPLERVVGRALVALAVWIGKTRLIDNMVLER